MRSGRELTVQHDTQRAVHVHAAVVIDESQLAKTILNVTRERVVPIISASVSWLSLSTTGNVWPLPQLCAINSNKRASRFSLL